MFICFLFLLVCHIMGCVWIYAASINVNYDNGDVIAISNENFDWV
jgi:hypothetical protein